MKKEQAVVLLPTVQQGIETYMAIDEAREDGKITWLEWFKIAREGADFFNEFKKLKGIAISEISEQELREVAKIIFEAFDKEVKFVEEDVFDFLMIMKHSASMFARKRR